MAKSIDPVRGPQALPRFGRLGTELRPKMHEAVVLRRRDGRLVELPRGAPPTLGQRVVGGFTEAYYVSVGVHTRSFTARLPTATVGVELDSEVDVELEVDDCRLLVSERRDDLDEQLGNWCHEQAARLTTRHEVGAANAGDELVTLGGQVANSLRTAAQRPNLPGLRLRELRVRLRYANKDIVEQHGADTLREGLRARKAQTLMAMYAPVYGPDLARIITLLADGHTDRIPEVVERIHASQQITEQRKMDLFQNLITSSTIATDVRARLAEYLSTMLGEGGSGDITDAIFAQAGAPALPADAANGKEHDEHDDDDDDI
jgi:hypothetical protein